MQEIFKDIPGYEEIYQVSNLGRVRKLSYLTPYSGDGYMRIRLCRGKNDHKMKLVHRLVAETFIANPNNLPEVNHKDENKSNNTVDNLEWCTRKYNINYGGHNKKVIETKVKKGIFNRIIYQYDIKGNLKHKYNNIKEIPKCFNESSVYHCIAKINGGLYNNFIWSYRELDNINIQDYIGKTNPKEILQYDKNNNLIRIWPSATSAASEKYNPSAIIQCCKGKVKTHKGYIWKYKNNV